MKKKNILLYTLGLSLSLGLYSCDNFLDLEPISMITIDNAYVTGSQLEAALTGTYESFQSSDYYVWDHVLFQDVRSDNHYAGGDNPEIFQIDALNINPTNGRVFNAWSNIYNAIAKANLVLERAPAITDPALTEQRRAQIMGEAAFLRAYHYYNLVKLWGGVPLVLETVKSADPAVVRVPRATEQEVYAQIIADLEFALDNRLPDTYGSDASVNKARATKGAANALLATVYAQMPTPNYNKVLEHANAVINSSAGYRLLENYDHLYDGNHYNNDESIMEVQYLGSNEGNWGPQMHLPPSLSGDTWRKFTTPSHDLVNAFDAEGDEIRKNATMVFEAVPWADEYWSNQTGSQVPFAYKWRNASGWASADRPYIFRLADIILLKAEALNELNRPTEAAQEVNRVRSRVSLEDVPQTTAASQTQMRTVILKERRLELAQEGRRWDDLVRYGVAREVMNNLNETDLRTGQRVNYNVTDADLLLPIPQQEINRNPTLEQNPL
ncbi:RagB/SusD family nutrient uptake outer membrane protein [Pontibacter sp. SGAir0037]|uniref:RagB/SusD family nutrient uptake outer membrane protein n=1 Tax=Pontibacter sp. SGAir0037 TaxID=2571030 RepID=UPI0010CD2DF5|nr:RagB/SusD family nutrient uptake outer membrane protein [Pontibacter sp. SGAir0037]QCR23256.1 RagB/SusD family nutrient uptake outer membrane protein [Pontibacter sp. SGAir0037]